MAEEAKAKEQKKSKKERAKLQRGKRRQGSEESDSDEEEEEEEDESDPNISWGVLAHEDEQADAGQANMTPIPQHALTQTEDDAPPRSAGEDVPPRSEEQVRPTPTDPIGGSKRPIADVAESESSTQPPKHSQIIASRWVNEFFVLSLCSWISSCDVGAFRRTISSNFLALAL